MADLPRCVKIDFLDKQSQRNLLDEGWREIGQLMTWRGIVDRVDSKHVKQVRGEDVVALAKEIKWSGRLWSDTLVSRRAAREETERYLLETSDPIHKIGEVGFIVSTATRIGLIGVHPMAAGCGLAATMIRATRPEHPSWLEAGTYYHNEAARSLYPGIGMKLDRRELVFHK